MEVLDDLSRSQKDAIAKVMEGVCEMIGEMAYSSDTTQCLAVAVALMIEKNSWISVDFVFDELKKCKEEPKMKGIIRKTREEITIVSYGGGVDRSDVLDYVSYIDSKGVEHPREKMNLYWDIEVIDDRQELAIQQLKNSKDAVKLTQETANRAFLKRELAALNIYTAIINGIYAKVGSGYWSPDEVSDIAEQYTATFMERFIKEETK